MRRHGVLKSSVGKALLAGSLVAVAVAGFYWVRERNECKLRGDALDARVEGIKRDLQKELPPGKLQEDVVRVFKKIGVRPDVNREWNQITGTINTKACSPGWYCGDSALVGITVKLDASGHVASTNVMTMFDNCL